MQPISGVPMYANCFDQLTTNGIIAEDLVGYVTGTPSPYLQNYVAQRGGVPNLPGQILPDTLTPPISGNSKPIVGEQTQPTKKTLPQGDIYNVTPKNIGPEILEPKNKKKINTIKQIATGVFLASLLALGLVKGKSVASKIKTLFNNAFKNTAHFKFQMPAWTQNIKQSVVNGFKKVCNFSKNIFNKIKQNLPVWTQKVKQTVVKGFNKVGNFFKGIWNKIFHKAPTP